MSGQGLLGPIGDDNEIITPKSKTQIQIFRKKLGGYFARLWDGSEEEIGGGSGGLPPSFQAIETLDDTTVSAVDVVAAGMTLTPPAGTYLVWFSGSTEKDDQSNAYESIYFNNIKVDSSEVRSGLNLGGVIPIPFTSIAKITVDGAQTIEGRWRVDGGTGTMHQRNLTIIQVGS